MPFPSSEFTFNIINKFREVLNECKATAAKRRKGSNRLEASGFTEQELYEQQQRLIDEAKHQQYLEEQQEFSKLQFSHEHIQLTKPVRILCLIR